jgi:predicted esterase
MGIQNVISYFDAVFESEELNTANNLIILGYSQGVSVALRYMASRKIQFQKLLIHSGGIPTELSREDFEYLNDDAEVQLIYGTRDEYLDAHRIAQEQKRARNLFGDRVLILPFDGIHEVNTELLKAAVTPR